MYNIGAKPAVTSSAVHKCWNTSKVHDKTLMPYSILHQQAPFFTNV